MTICKRPRAEFSSTTSNIHIGHTCPCRRYCSLVRPPYINIRWSTFFLMNLTYATATLGRGTSSFASLPLSAFAIQKEYSQSQHHRTTSPHLMQHTPPLHIPDLHIQPIQQQHALRNLHAPLPLPLNPLPRPPGPFLSCIRLQTLL